MKESGQKHGALRRDLAALYKRLRLFAEKLSHDIEIELQRLNSARIGKSELARLSSRQATQAVKAALDAYHRERSRCC